MRHLLIPLLLLTASGEAAADDEALQVIGHVEGRTAIRLDGDWNVIVDPYDSGRLSYRGQPLADGYFKDAKPRDPSDRVEYDFDASPTLQVPGDWNSQRPELDGAPRFHPLGLTGRAGRPRGRQ